MRGSVPTHALTLLALLGWTVVTTVRERLGIPAPEVKPTPPAVAPKRPQSARHDPGWIWIN